MWVIIGIAAVIIYQATLSIAPAGAPSRYPYLMIGRDLLGIAGSFIIIVALLRRIFLAFHR